MEARFVVCLQFESILLFFTMSSDEAMSAASHDSENADDKENLDDFQDDVQNLVKQWHTSRGVNVSTNNFFKEHLGKLGSEEKKKKPKNYLKRTLIKVWKGSVIKDIKKKLACKALIMRCVKSFEDGKFDIARSPNGVITNVMQDGTARIAGSAVVVTL